MAREMLIPNWQQQLASGTGLSQDQARWVIDSWSLALDGAPAPLSPDPYEEERKKAGHVDTAGR